MNVLIGERLKTICSMTVGRVCADIGTDHALLPCYLIYTGKADYCYACDIAKGPLLRAKANIEKYALADKIETVLMDGISPEISRKCDSIIIAGMGGEMIADILARGGITDKNTLILQPMSRSSALRRDLNINGFRITDEVTFTDKGRVYSVIKAQRGADIVYTPGMLEMGRFIMERKNDTDMIYMKKRLASLKKQARSGDADYYNAAIKETEDIL